jgi:hypothetical protein
MLLCVGVEASIKAVVVAAAVVVVAPEGATTTLTGTAMAPAPTTTTTIATTSTTAASVEHVRCVTSNDIWMSSVGIVLMKATGQRKELLKLQPILMGLT